jgi:hypothetical protein
MRGLCGDAAPYTNPFSVEDIIADIGGRGVTGNIANGRIAASTAFYTNPLKGTSKNPFIGMSG